MLTPALGLFMAVVVLSISLLSLCLKLKEEEEENQTVTERLLPFSIKEDKKIYFEQASRSPPNNKDVVYLIWVFRTKQALLERAIEAINNFWMIEEYYVETVLKSQNEELKNVSSKCLEEAAEMLHDIDAEFVDIVNWDCKLNNKQQTDTEILEKAMIIAEKLRS